MPRPKRKTVTTTLKMTPEVKELWELCADAEHRTLTNMFEMMVFEYAKKLKITRTGSSVEPVISPKSTTKN
jgi:hypothetical protein